MIVDREVVRVVVHGPDGTLPLERLRESDGAIAITASSADLDRIAGYLLIFRPPGGGNQARS
ncbi:MAG: hypothetical protein ACOC2D_09315 [Spirochaetota bacterium]